MTGLTTHMPIDPGPLAGTRPVDAAVRQRAIPHLGRSAIVEGDRCVSYAELQGRVERLARVLQRLGVQRHDRIAVLSENRAE